MARSTMAALIARERILINDPAGASELFSDDDIQNVMDARRIDVVNGSLTAKPTFTGTTIQYLDYFSDWGDWEDSPVLKQYLTTVVTPSTSENIVGHWTFAATTLPPVFITGKTFDLYAAAADLLERWAAKWVLSYGFSSDGQSFQRQQVVPLLQAQAKQYRMKQRPVMINATRSDLVGAGQGPDNALAARPIDFFSSGDGR